MVSPLMPAKVSLRTTASEYVSMNLRQPASVSPPQCCRAALLMMLLQILTELLTPAESAYPQRKHVAAVRPGCRIAAQVEGRIRAGPRADLDAFLSALVRLEASIAFFQKNRCALRT